MGAWNYQTTGTPAVISANVNGYINGFINIQPDQGLLQDIGTFIGHQLTVYQTVNNAQQLTVSISGETDKYNTWARIEIFENPKVG